MEFLCCSQGLYLTSHTNIISGNVIYTWESQLGTIILSQNIKQAQCIPLKLNINPTKCFIIKTKPQAVETVPTSRSHPLKTLYCLSTDPYTHTYYVNIRQINPNKQYISLVNLTIIIIGYLTTPDKG